MNSNDLKFTLNYAVSLVIIISICVYLVRTVPALNPAVVVMIGLFAAYLVVNFINYSMPSFTTTTDNVSQYVQYSMYSNFNELGYLNVWPPLFVVLIIFIILLYNGQLRPKGMNLNQ